MQQKRQNIFMIALCTFALAGCQKSIGPAEALPVQFAVSAENVTKGELINTDGSDKALADKGVTSFSASAYNGTSALFSNQNVTYASGKWSTASTYYWNQGAVLNFFASANLPGASGAAAVNMTSTAQTLAYDLSKCSDATLQKDILLGFYKGTGNNTGTASISFRHPLSAVGFVIDDISGEKVKTITVSGIYKSGTATMNATGTISWSSQVAGGTVTQTKDGGLDIATSDPKIVGSWFMLIPQTLETGTVTLTVTFVSLKTATAKLPAGSWSAGSTSIYKLKYEGISPMDAVLTVTLADWQTLKNKDGGDVFDVTFGTKPTE